LVFLLHFRLTLFYFSFFFLMLLRPPRSTLFPYTTLFRSCGLEIAEQLTDFDSVIVPVGGGGLISGISIAVKALRPSSKVFGVERSEEHTSELQSRFDLVCRLLLEKKKKKKQINTTIRQNH